MPPNSTLLKIYDDITIGKCSYCFLCFRTDSESKLKIPKPYLQSTTSLSTLEDINNKAPRICYMCETLAIAAAKFRKAAFFATSIDILFKNMIQSDKYRNEVRRLLEKDGPVDPAEFNKHRNLFIGEQELNLYRNITRLHLTDVVVIDTDDVITTDPNTTIKKLWIPTKTSQTSQTSQTEEATINIPQETDSVMEPQPIYAVDPTPEKIIHDDDSSKQTTKTRSRTEAAPPVHDNLTSNKKAKLKDKPQPAHEVTKEGPRLVPIEKLLKTPELAASFGYLHPVFRNPDGTCLVPTLSAQIIDGQIMYQDREVSEELGPDALITNNNVIIPEGQKTKAVIFMENYGTVQDVQAAVDNMLVNKLEDMKRCQLDCVKSEPQPVLEVDGQSKGKQPLMRTDRIDWEDRIPMDVISFMNATDPNPPSFVQPLMPPEVCNVGSLTGGRIARIHNKDEFLDQSSET